VSRVVRAPSAPAPAAQSFGARLRRLRTEGGLRQCDLAGENISASYISFLEADRRVPTERVVRQLAERLGCRFEDLWPPAEETARSSAATATVELKLARAALTVGQLAEAEERYGRILAEHGGDLDVAREAEYGLARAAEFAGRFDEAAVRYRQCLGAAEDPTYPHWLGATLGLVRSLARGEDAERAVTTATEARQQVSEVGLDASDVTVEICAILAKVLCDRGEYAAASKPIAEALAIVSDIAAHQPLARLYWRASVAAHQVGRTGYALELASRIVDVGEQDYGHTVGMLRAVYGGLLLRQSPPDLDLARNTLEQAVGDLERSGKVADAMRCRNDLVLALVRLDRPDEARQLAGQVVAAAGVPVEERVRARLLGATAQSLLGDLDGARTSCAQAGAELAELPASPEVTRLWSQLGEALTQVGSTEDAILAYRHAISGLGVDLPPTLQPSAGGRRSRGARSG
jgi:tetratricopeptide (TPR) repeat protein